MPARKKPASKAKKHEPRKGPRPQRRQEWEQPERLVLLQGWARDGLTQEEIAHNVGVTPETISRWKKDSDQIAQALKEGREVVNRLVENALIKRALGFEYTEVTDESGDKYSHKEVKKYVVPDVGAAIFVLCNRMGDVWKQKRQDDTDNDAALKKLDDVLEKLDTDIEALPDTPADGDPAQPQDKEGGGG